MAIQKRPEELWEKIRDTHYPHLKPGARPANPPPKTAPKTKKK